MNAYLSIASGVLLGFSRPFVIASLGETPIEPTGISGLLVFVAYIPVLYAVLRADAKRAFWLGFLSSFVQCFITLYWFVIAMDFVSVPKWISIPALSLACMELSLPIASAFVASKYLSLRLKWPFLFVMPIALCAAEYARNFIFFGGFPWVSSSYALTSIPVLLQGASLVGAYGLVLLIVFCNCALVSMNRRYLAAALVMLLAWVTYGAWRLNHPPGPVDFVRVGLIQGNIGQGIINQSDVHADEILTKYRRLSEPALKDGVELMVWPESAYPLNVSERSPELRDIGKLPYTTIIGGVGFDSTHMYNSAFVVDSKAKIRARVDKSHLVPFGEYVPWPFQSIVNRIVPGMGSFGRGKDFHPINVELAGGRKLPIAVSICYEGVFPEISRVFTENGAKLFVNVTNDAWYGVSSAPYQHLNMYPMRAVETGRPFVRSTNTGITAWVDARGQIHQATKLYTDDVVTASIPINHERTVYIWLGDSVAYLCTLLMIFAVIGALLGRDVFVRKRSKLSWIVGAAGFLLVAWSRWHFAAAEFDLDEAAATRNFFVTAFGLLVGTAVWSGRAWARPALLWMGTTAIVVCSLIALAEGPIYLIGAAAGLFVVWFGQSASNNA